MIELRATTASDEPAIAALLARSYGVLLVAAYAPAVLRAALPAITRPNPVLLRSGRYLVALDGAAPVGCGGWSFALPGRDDDGPPPAPTAVAHVRHVAVDPAAARRGIGRLLLERCHRDAAAAGARELEVLSTLNAVPFYEAAGYVQVEERTVPIGGVDFPCVLLRRAIG